MRGRLRLLNAGQGSGSGSDDSRGTLRDRLRLLDLSAGATTSEAAPTGCATCSVVVAEGLRGLNLNHVATDT